MKKAEKKGKEKEISLFDNEIAKLPPELKTKLETKKELIEKFATQIEKTAGTKTMGIFISAEIEVKNNLPMPNFDKLTINFLLDDFENPIQYFDAKILLGLEFDKLLEEKKIKDSYGNETIEYLLKADKKTKFYGTSISIIRENCFDGTYDDLKKIGSSIVYSDTRGFISALKTIEIHKNMLLQKFEKYIVAYTGVGSWLRGEKSNDFDVFVVIDDTDVKRMPRMQVKDQLTKIIWQMANEVSILTGIHIHTQVYLLTDFWDALKDAHPVMFTFLRDGVPFYDRGIYGAWKELLKLGKIKPSPEAIDMHMNVGTQLIDRSKKMFAEIVMNDIYWSVLNPSQAILMLKGYNPTTPKETVKMFKEVLLEKEKSITKKELEILEHTVKTYKGIEHDKTLVIKGKDVDKMIKDAEDYLKKIKHMFEEVSEQRTKESIISAYHEFLNQVRQLTGFSEYNEEQIFSNLETEYLKTGRLPAFVRTSVKNLRKAKKDYDLNKLTITEVNKVLKEVRNVLSEIKNYIDKSVLNEVGRKKLNITYDDGKNADILCFEGKTYLFDNTEGKTYILKENKFEETNIKKETLIEPSKISSIKFDEKLVEATKKILKTKDLFL